MAKYKSEKEVIQAFMRSLDKTELVGKAALDEALKACSNYGSIDNLINNFISDCANSKNGTTFLKEYCGIDLDNEDTGAITGSDAGGSKVKTAKSIVPEYGNVQSFDRTEYDSFYESSKKRLLIYVPESIKTNQQQQTIVNGLFTWWTTQSLDLIEESYGSNFGFSSNSSATVKEMTLKFYREENDVLASITPKYRKDNYSRNMEAYSLQLNINMNLYDDLYDAVNGGSNKTNTYLDRTLAHEFTHAVMMANIKYFYYLPQFIKEGMAELTHGIDDTRRENIIGLANYPEQLRTKLNISDTGTGDSDAYAAGYMILRYLAKQASSDNDGLAANSISNTSNNKLITGRGGNDSIVNRGSNVSISGGIGNDTIVGSNNTEVFIYSDGDGHDVLTNFDSNDFIYVTSGKIADKYKTDGSDVILELGNGSIRFKNAAGNLNNLPKLAGNSGTISGTNGNDTLNAGIWRNTVNGGAGNDSIYGNDFAHVYQFGVGDGNDTIFGFNENDSIQIYYGTIWESVQSGNDVVVRAYDGSITLKDAIGKKINVPGEYNPKGIYNTTSGSVVSGTSSGEFINNAASKATINGNGGADTIHSGWRASLSAFNGGAGNDLIFIESGYETVDGGTGNDSIYADISKLKKGRVYKIDANGGKDVVLGYNSTDTVRIADSSTYSTTKSGSDVIINVGDSARMTLKDAASTQLNISGGKKAGGNTLISGTSDNDRISLSGGHSGVTIVGGAGNDIIYGDNAAHIYQFGIGDGNDTIYNYNSNDTLQFLDGTRLATVQSGNDVVVRAYGCSITLKDAIGKKITLPGGYSPKGIYNTTSGSVVSGTSSGELINNTESKVTINGNGGNDTIHSGWAASLSAINGGAGNDLIVVSSGYETVDGGTGNDTIYADISYFNKGRVYKTRANGGNDVVIGYSANDTVRIADASIYSTTKSGSDMIIKVGDSAQMTLKDAASTKVNISGGKRIGGNTLISGTSDNDRISLSGGYSGVTLIGGKGNDLIYGDNAAHVYRFGIGDGNDTIFNYNSNDTLQFIDGTMNDVSTVGNDVVVKAYGGSITLKNAAGKKINRFGGYNPKGIYNTKSGSVVSGTSSGEFINNAASKVTINGNGGNDTIHSGWAASLSAVNGGAGNDLIFIESGYETVDGGTGNDTVYANISMARKGRVYKIDANGGKDVVLGYTANDTVRIADASIYSTTKSGSDMIIKVGDSAQMTLKDAASTKVNISGGKRIGGNTLISGTSDNDRISLSGGYSGVTIVGGAGNDIIYGDNAAQLYQFGVGFGNDTIYNYSSNDTLQFYNGTIISTDTLGNDVVVKAYGGSITLKNAAAQKITSKVGYNPKGIYNTKAGAVVNGTSSGEFINNTASKATINGNGGADTIHSGSRASLSAVNSGAGNDIIVVSSGYETIDGGTGNDSIYADISSAHKGRVYKTKANGGKDVVIGYTANDTVRITDGSPCSTTKSGSDLIVKVGNAAQMTLKNAASKKLNLVGNGKFISNKTQNKTLKGTSNKDSITNNASNVTINAGSSNDTIQTYGNYVSVMGGSGNDSIKSTGGSKVTLYGGAGNDTLTGSSKADIFQVRADGGKDVITNCGINDSIKSTYGSIKKYSTSGNDYILKFDDPDATGTVTLKNVADNYTVVKSGSVIKLKSKSSSSQLPADDDYWFLDDKSIEESPLNEIISTDNAVEFDEDFENELSKRSTELMLVSTRHRRQK